MKLPAKIEYACKAVFELALRYNADMPVRLNTISETQGIPKKFLIQLMLRLKNAHLVNTSRGIQGGYYLVRPPSEITLAQIFRAVDSSILEGPRHEKRKANTGVHRILFSVWGQINEYAAKKLEGLTLEELIKELNGEELTYNI